MAKKKAPKKKQVKKKAAKKPVAKKAAPKKAVPKKKAAARKAVPKKAALKKAALKPAAAKKAPTKKPPTRAAVAAKASAAQKTALPKAAPVLLKAPKAPPARQHLESPRNQRGLGSGSAGQSGDLQGLSVRERDDSESVEELVEEGQAWEASAISGVEDADGDPKEVRTHEVPEDDVPEEYLDDENNN
jgi:hypothetical protein